MDPTWILAIPYISSYILSTIFNKLGVSYDRGQTVCQCFEFVRAFTHFAVLSHTANPDFYTPANVLQAPVYNFLCYMPFDVMCFVIGILIKNIIYEIRLACFYFQVFSFLAMIIPTKLFCAYNVIRVIMIATAYYQLRMYACIKDIAISSLFGVYCLVIINFYSNVHYFSLLLLDFAFVIVCLLINFSIFAFLLLLIYVRSSDKILQRELNIWVFALLFIGHGSCILLWLNVVMFKLSIDFEIVDYLFWIESSVIIVGMISHRNEKLRIVFPNFVLSLWVSLWLASWVLGL
jgi:hypothetical protein